MATDEILFDAEDHVDLATETRLLRTSANEVYDRRVRAIIQIPATRTRTKEIQIFTAMAKCLAEALHLFQYFATRKTSRLR